MHLEKRFGTQAKNMTLILRNQNGENLAVMDNDY